MKRILSLILSLAMLAFPCVSFGAATLAPNPKPQYFNNSGYPCSGCKLWFYESGSSTAKTTWTDSTKATANSNPVTLNSRGEAPAGIWLDGTYSVTLKTSAGATIWGPIAGVTGISDTAAITAALSGVRWVDSDITATYISASSFSTPGDYTSTFPVGRRLDIELGASHVYGRITASTYATGTTTVTVALDSGSITTAISGVNISVESPTNTSLSFDMISSGTSAANLNSSGSNTWSGAQTVTGAITSSGGLTSSGSTTLSGGGSITGTYSGAHTLSGAVTMSGGLTSSGGGSITGTYSGNHTLSGVVTASGGLTSSGTTTVSGGGSITGSYAGDHTLSGNITILGGLTSSGSTTLSGGGSISGTYSGIPTFSSGLISSGTMTGNASGITLRDEISSKNSGTVTVTGGTTSITTVDFGTVTAGDRISIKGLVRSTKGGTAGYSWFFIGKSAGTATVTFYDDSSTGAEHKSYVPINEDLNVSLDSVCKVTGNGTLTIYLAGYSAGSNSSVNPGSGQLYGFFLKKQ